MPVVRVVAAEPERAILVVAQVGQVANRRVGVRKREAEIDFI
jgi:hypothetical protein